MRSLAAAADTAAMFPSLAKTAALAVVLALAAAAPAAADSIAYVKAGDVWLATPDGSRQQQITHTGIYSYVSQADTGEMIALAPGERLHKLSRTGKVLADFGTTVSDGMPQAGPVNKFHGPFSPEISPDGSKVAFEWVNDSYSEGTGCSETTVPPCFVYAQSQGVAITHSDRYTGPEAFGLMTGWIYPHWMSNDMLLRSFSGAIMNDDAVFTRVGAGLADTQLDPWFFDEWGYGVDDVELSRDLQTVAGIAGQSSEKLRVYRTLMHPFGAPDWDHTPFRDGNQPVAQPCYELGDPIGGKFESLSLAPDGRGLAYGVGDGIWVAPLDCGAPSTGRLAIPGGRFPDWGPADVPAGAPGGLSVRVGRAKLGRSLPVKVNTGGAGRVAAKVLLGRRTIGARSASVGASGRGVLRVKLARAALRGRRSARVTVRVQFRPGSGGTVQRGSVRVTLRR
jgi:hypothetical protein